MLLQVIVLLVSFYEATGFKILCFLPIGGKSHEEIFLPVVDELVKSNHEVTCIWPHQYPKKMEYSNLKIISMEQTAMRESKSMQKFSEIPSTNPLIFFSSFTDFTSPSCETFFQNKQVQSMLKNGLQFDLMVFGGFMNECAITIAHLIANYTVMLSPNTIMPWTPVQIPRPPSFVPNMMLPYTDDMTFFQRMRNSFYFIAIRTIHDYYIIPTFEQIAKKYVPESSSVNAVLSNISLILTNSDPVIISPRPSMPNVVGIGCIHCRKAMPVSKEFEDFLDGSGDDGFILFSLGSNAQSKYLPKEIKQQLLQLFSNLKQRVIWKYEEEMHNVPTNIKVTKWMPQQDILGHPKIRLFITHGGLLSLQQAVYHGVPVVGIPLFSDQKVNMARVEQLHIGRMLDFTNITVKNLEYNINEILQDKNYGKNMKKYSKILRGQIDQPAKKAVFWIEYIIRHSGQHLRSGGEKLSCLQYFSLDLVLLLVVMSFLIVFFVKVVVFCFKKFIFKSL